MCRAISRRWRAMRESCWTPVIESRARGRSICSRPPRTSRRSSLSRVSGLDQAFEQLAEFTGAPEILRMPLHGNTKGRVGLFHRLDHAVGRGGGDVEALGHVPDRLVMAAVDVARLTIFHVIGKQRRQARAL